MASSTKPQAGSQLLTKSSWDPGELGSLSGAQGQWDPSGGPQPETSSPEEAHGTPEMVLLLLTQETKGLGQGR